MWKYPYKTKPYEHQRNALNESAEKSQWAYFMEMGTGKTKVTIDNMAFLFFKRQIDAALVIAPKSVYLNWELEIQTHLPDVLKHKIFILSVGFNDLVPIQNTSVIRKSVVNGE